ncbi:MAG: hypothetical protein NC238_13405 [Dehalobacter sp.]|nr:hypothetical protein [Dehalobacter sp.]
MELSPLKVQILLSLSKEIYLNGSKDFIVNALAKNGIFNFKEIDDNIKELVDIGHIGEQINDFYVLKFTGIRYLIDHNLTDNIDILIKLMQIHQEFTNISNKLQGSLSEAEIRVQTLTAKNIQMEYRLNNQVEEMQSMKTKYIEIFGVFIAIFSIFGLNISFIKEISQATQLFNLFSSLLIVNGTMILSIMILLLAIKSLILNEYIKIKKLIFFTFTPTIILIIGIIMSVFKSFFY